MFIKRSEGSINAIIDRTDEVDDKMKKAMDKNKKDEIVKSDSVNQNNNNTIKN